MCMVSVIHDYGRKLPPLEWTPDILETFKDTLKKAEAYDEKTHQKDCLDPQKAEFLKDVEKHLEEKYGIQKKFDWEIGDTVISKKEVPVISNKTFMADITLRAGLTGIIEQIHHHKTEVTVWVRFEVITQLIPFRGKVASNEITDCLDNVTAHHRSLPYNANVTNDGTRGIIFNNNIKYA